MKLLKELNTFEDDVSNSNDKESDEDNNFTQTMPSQQVIQKEIDLEAINGVESDKGSYSSEDSADNGVKNTPFFSLGAFGTNMVKGQVNPELDKV